MKNIKIAGTTQISGEGIKKHFCSIEPWLALSELIWNGFDAGATKLDVRVVENPMDGTESITVFDNGSGIDLDTHEDTFGRFYDSSKKGDVTLHGAHGRGRLAFHRLCRNAMWQTRSISGSGKIEIDAASIKDYAGDRIDSADLPQELQTIRTGTLVTLTNFTQNVESVRSLYSHFSIEFGWFLALNRKKSLTLNGDVVCIPSHELSEARFSIDKFEFDCSVIRWDKKPHLEKSYIYVCNSQGKNVGRELSSFNYKSPFYISIYVKSTWADSFSVIGGDLINVGARGFESETWRKLAKELHNLTQVIYEKFLQAQFEKEIEHYVAEGIFPSYAGLPEDYRKWRFANTKNILRAIYQADPTALSSLKKKQKKIIVRLLDKLAVSNENDAIFEVLNDVLDLDDAATKAFAGQLKHTTLENIISTIEVLQRRGSVAAKLREIMNVHYKTVRETPDLQRIIENNTWLFGHQYETIGAEEDTFTKIARDLREKIKGVSGVDDDDFDSEDAVDIDGARRQSDLFLARKVPSLDSLNRPIYRCILIEIKRPSISLNVKHLRQLDDYASIIKRHPEFSSECLHFELILVGRKISSADTEIESRMNGQVAKGQMGLVSDDERMKRYVLNWYTLLDSFELANKTMLQTLKLKREDLSGFDKDSLVADLQTATV